MNPLISNDAVVLGILLSILAFVFYTSNLQNNFWQKFYKIFPPLLLCYFIPGIFNSTGIISAEESNLYFVASRFLLPASLVLLTLSIDFKSIIKLGPKAIIMSLTATASIIIGGPIAIIIVSAFSPELVGGIGPDAVWRGLATVAGSWIGGGANQTAMKEIFGVSGNLFSAIVVIDVLVYSIWMAILLYGAGITTKIDKKLKADTTSISNLQNQVEKFQSKIVKIPNLHDLMLIAAIGFGITGVSHLLADIITPFIQENYPQLQKFSLTSHFFWVIMFATTGGLLISFTKARNLEGAGASKIGSLLLYILVTTIGMQMNILAIFDNLGIFLVLGIWMLFHSLIILIVGKIIKAPFFFIAVGSQSNIGGAASAPIVAAAFHPSLATVGVLLAVLGYAIGTYGAWLCAILMSAVAP